MIYAASLGSGGAGGGGGSGSGGDDDGEGMPALVFYIATAWAALGCVAACSLPSLEEADLRRAQRELEAGMGKVKFTGLTQTLGQL